MIQLELFLRLQHEDSLEDFSRSDDIDEAVDVHIHESGHQELTVEPVHNPAMTGDQISEIFNLERPFKSRREEASERPDDTGEERHEECVDEERINSDGFLHS